MKSYPSEIFTNSKIAQCTSLLLYGPNEPLSHFISQFYREKWKSKNLEPKTILGEDLKTNTGLLDLRPSLFGNQSFYIIQNANKTILKTHDFLAKDAAPTIVLAPNLKAADAIVKNYNTAEHAAAIGCYENDTRFMQAYLANELPANVDKRRVSTYILSHTNNIQLVSNILSASRQLDAAKTPDLLNLVQQYLETDVETNFFDFVYSNLANPQKAKSLSKFESYLKLQPIQALKQLKYIFYNLYYLKFNVKEKKAFIPFAYKEAVERKLTQWTATTFQRIFQKLDNAENNIKYYLSGAGGTVVSKTLLDVLKKT